MRHRVTSGEGDQDYWPSPASLSLFLYMYVCEPVCTTKHKDQLGVFFSGSIHIVLRQGLSLGCNSLNRQVRDHQWICLWNPLPRLPSPGFVKVGFPGWTHTFFLARQVLSELSQLPSPLFFTTDDIIEPILITSAYSNCQVKVLPTYTHTLLTFKSLVYIPNAWTLGRKI